MGKKLAIKGHPTRGKEVIELLEMMGGVNADSHKGNFSDEWKSSYYIYGDNTIQFARDEFLLKLNFVIFTLEEFLEKYPFKVNDKVIDKADGCPGVVCEMKWDEDVSDMKYCVVYENGIEFVDFDWFANDSIEFYKEDKNLEENKLFGTVSNPVETQSYTVSLKDDKVIDNSIDASQFMQMGKVVAVCFNTENYENEVELQLGDYEIVVRDGKTYAVKKRPKYPTTYAECCKVLGISYRAQLSYTNPDVERGNVYLTGEKHLLDAFIKLRICINAYWKIAGEEMGLGKPWEPNWTTFEGMPAIFRFRYNIVCDSIKDYHCLLVFPTTEMRDAFYENFKDLIEQCKELL